MSGHWCASFRSRSIFRIIYIYIYIYIPVKRYYAKTTSSLNLRCRKIQVYIKDVWFLSITLSFSIVPSPYFSVSNCLERHDIAQLVARRALDRSTRDRTRSLQLHGGLISPSFNSCGRAAKSQLPWRGLAVIYVYTYHCYRAIVSQLSLINERLCIIIYVCVDRMLQA
jgi:hypothetical protein